MAYPAPSVPARSPEIAGNSWWVLFVSYIGDIFKICQNNHGAVSPIPQRRVSVIQTLSRRQSREPAIGDIVSPYVVIKKNSDDLDENEPISRIRRLIVERLSPETVPNSDNTYMAPIGKRNSSSEYIIFKGRRISINPAE